MKVLIVDDEFNSRRIVRKLLAERFPDLVFLNDASGTAEAELIIQEDQPDIVFLDIQMNASTGFELLKKITDRTFEVVFITAYDHYALKAFDFGAANYVLKPIDREKLYMTVEKLIDQIYLKQNHLNTEQVVAPMDKLILPSGESSIVVEVKDIIYVKADGMYCEVYLKKNQGKILIVKPLNYLENKLEGHPYFLRVHKSYLVNMNSITKISGDRTSLVLADEVTVPIARLRKDELKEKLKNNFY